MSPEMSNIKLVRASHDGDQFHYLWAARRCLMPHTFVVRKPASAPASAAGPLVGHSDLVETLTSRARAPGAGQGTRPTDAMRKWEKYVAFGVGACDFSLPPRTLSLSRLKEFHLLRVPNPKRRWRPAKKSLTSQSTTGTQTLPRKT
jgi:hypothetical protein